MIRDNKVLPLTRYTFAALALFTTIFGLLLLLFPNRTETTFVWTITPPMSAVFVGAGYTFAAITIWHLLWQGRWHSIRMALAGTWAFSAGMLGATLLHWDRFRHDTILIYGWLLVYFAALLLLPAAYRLNQSRDPGPTADELRVSPTTRSGMTVIGLFFTVVGLLMFFSPTAFADSWPWTLTPLMSRVIGSWLLVPGVSALLAYSEPRWSSYRPLLRASLAWLLILLVGSILHRNDFDFSRPLSTIWFVALIGWIVLNIALFIYHERSTRPSLTSEAH
jgi:hypothetical protein